MASNQASSASSTNQPLGSSGMQPAAAASGKKAKKAPGERKASPKVKALTEVRTFLIRQRASIEGRPESVERDIELETFDRMLDSVEQMFPKGHAFNIKRKSNTVVAPMPESTGEA